MRSVALGISAAIVCFSTTALAADFYVDPVNGSAAGDGSSAKPWKSINEVISTGKVQTQGWDVVPHTSASKLVAKNASGVVKAGDTLWLRDGYHGSLDITSHYNTGLITVAAQAGHTPKLSKVLVRSSSNWKLVGLAISPDFAPTYAKATMVAIENHASQGPVSEITVESCVLRS